MDAIYASEINRGVAPAAPSEFAPLRLGPLSVWPPVVLAPMAGVTNYPFRSICRRYGAGLYVSEMITAKALVIGNEKTLRLAGFGPDESPRSLQLYGVDPVSLGEAARRLVGEGKVDHLDLNFGCPVKKVTAKGGGAAIPLKPRLLARLVRAVVGGSGGTPVTMKFRKGVDEARLTYRDAGRVGEEEGCVAVGLHARTAAQLYDGEADWEAIADLKSRLKIPVLGNGDIWEGEDALRMMRQTGCDGVIVGRGCLGRPWLFRDLADLFDGRPPRNPPHLGEVVAVMLEHARLLRDWAGETRGILMMRKFATWYTKAFPHGAALRESLTRVRSLAELEAAVEGLDPLVPFPAAGMRAKRGKRSGTQKVSLPPGYADAPDDDTLPGADAEDAFSGG
ncbi:MAG: tRNA dihydrouridine synthase DusB [Planctomycetes bacterium]|nr:tRNA dihydrouridine synthase DusB [Planctomycetota bacterium]